MMRPAILGRFFIYYPHKSNPSPSPQRTYSSTIKCIGGLTPPYHFIIKKEETHIIFFHTFVHKFAPLSLLLIHRAQQGKHTNMKLHEIDYKIYGDDMQIVSIELDPQETVIAEAGSMNWMDSDIKYEAKMGDGSQPEKSIFGKLLDIDQKTGKFKLSHKALLPRPERDNKLKQTERE